ncbi:hypothetical protein ABPG73_004633 [Tetrahymena malaccensis]
MLQLQYIDYFKLIQIRWLLVQTRNTQRTQFIDRKNFKKNLYQTSDYDFDILDINLSGSNICDSKLQILSDGLKQQKQVTELNLGLSQNKINSKGAQVFAQLIGKYQSISCLSLKLENNSILLEGAQKIIDAIKNLQKITQITLNLRKCNIRNEQAKEFQNQLEKKFDNIDKLLLNFEQNEEQLEYYEEYIEHSEEYFEQSEEYFEQNEDHIEQNEEQQELNEIFTEKQISVEIQQVEGMQNQCMQQESQLLSQNQNYSSKVSSDYLLLDISKKIKLYSASETYVAFDINNQNINSDNVRDFAKALQDYQNIHILTLDSIQNKQANKYIVQCEKVKEIKFFITEGRKKQQIYHQFIKILKMLENSEQITNLSIQLPSAGLHQGNERICLLDNLLKFKNLIDLDINLKICESLRNELKDFLKKKLLINDEQLSIDQERKNQGTLKILC